MKTILLLLKHVVLWVVSIIPLMKLLNSNKLKGAENYFEWQMNMRLVLEYEKLTYVTINPLPVDIDSDSTPKERETFDRWKDDNLKVKS